ncbi:NAD-glutamate dehydrogenase [Denitromonas ohlonensis]|uniref:NAD-glutamate dehydrogenase n=2 Tax=Denitromonas TaxID=139331 RepID=A0A557REV8_9RHOO|nr:NAD-glutamate dehydrogenase [Denitromonas ohlonensis]TVO63667.1 NAD-glutamate dehydrogenase [Denitromonas ohlonensis]TVO74201.1 NAD-glutamate dehydrogenase [Denitromonas ohlonensis]
MSPRTDEAGSSQIEAVVELIRSKLAPDQAAVVEPFARKYYNQVDTDDLAGFEVADLYGAVLSHWQFARKHEGDTKVRVYNPRMDEHGWESTHTVIELVGPDMPFLVDSIGIEVNRQGLTLHLIIHPVMAVARDAKGQYQRMVDEVKTKGARYESIIHVEVDRRTEPADLEAIKSGIERVLKDVRVAVADWPAMTERLKEVIADAGNSATPESPDEVAEVKAFLEWLSDDNFVLLGCRDYDLISKKGENELRIRSGSGLGLLRETGDSRQSMSFAALPPQLKAQAHLPNLLTITKSNTRSTVHRQGYLDHLSIKCFDAKGKVTGERRIIGLLTSTAYNTNPTRIPLLRRKVQGVIERAGLMPKSHAGKALATILEQYPRDELFQSTPDELFNTATGILRLGERQRIRLFARSDAYARFVSCLIYIPRENYNTEQRKRMQAVLMEAFEGVSSEFEVHFSESALARVLIIVRTKDSVIPTYDVREIETRLINAARRWEDGLQSALIEHHGEERGMRLCRSYATAFPAGYREDYPARIAVHDIDLMESLDPRSGLGMNLYIPLEAPQGHINFKLFHTGAPVPLSSSLPMLERTGVKVIEERPYRIERQDGSLVWVHDFGMQLAGVEELDLERLRPLFHEVFARAWCGDIENDDFNRLTLLAGLDWREVSMLRAYAKHMKQAAFTFSQTYMEQTLANYPALTAQLVKLFKTRFDPAEDTDRNARCEKLVTEINATLDNVANLDEDRILRQFLAMIQATLRTNFYQPGKDGKPKSYLSFKFNPSLIPNLPEPKPMFEISVYSPRVEGVHLRGGKVARGGLRWSDRMEDFRTEILGLVKAQIVKNAVIVPVGSKGGFVVKTPPPAGDREAMLAEGVACYRMFLSGLLDVTDNLVLGEVVPPASVVRHDEDDPYLVVAADKGTATFSDIANSVAAEYGFWLGDAFASGGSVGYDHKKMGITARGAWESVKRHFREMGINTQEEPFTVAGVGDMSGDVFGNGMLLSKKIKLVAAFDHRHIFFDPDPNPETSWVERDRMFALPRSSWDDYDRKLISKGGGIWPRSAKSIPLSEQMRKVLDTDATALPPTELIRCILKAPIDLLYNGGIGTYIKANSETDASVGDRANDAVRVNGRDLRCKVFGEGGNLGATQLGRIEFALNGGRICTDAIDNSGGVDCSDHEVNIKILLNGVVAEGELTDKQRNKLLMEMTDEVATLVLRDNYYQTQILSVTRARGTELVDAQARFMRRLGNAGRLNRKIEFLPFDEEIAERKAAGAGLTSPELAVLLAYSKIELYDEVLASDIPEDPYISTALTRYFPVPLRERFADQIQRHALKREIIATHVINSMVNRVGATFVGRLKEETGATAPDIVRAYLATREVFSLVSVWADIEALDNQIPDAVQTRMIIDSGRLVMRGTLWFLRHPDLTKDLSKTLKRFIPGAKELAESLEEVVGAGYKKELDRLANGYTEQGVPEALARRVAGLDELYSALDLVELTTETKRDQRTAAAVYFALGERFDLHWLGKQITSLPADTHWQSLARTALRDDLSAQARNLAANVLRLSPKLTEPDALIKAWETQRSTQIDRSQQLFADIKSSTGIDMPMLSVTLRELRNLA